MRADRSVDSWRATESSEHDRADTGFTAPRHRPGLVVLPFHYRGAAAGEEIFDGVDEAVRSALARVETFFVFARGALGAPHDVNVDVGEMARALGARYVIQGSMRASAGRFRISVQLTDAVSGAEIWSAPFEGVLGDTIESEDRIANAIAGALQPAILTAEVARVQSRRSDATTAYQIVLQAMPLCWALDKAACDTAIRLLTRAVQLDPGYGLAQALLSWCHGQQAVYNWTAAGDLHRQRALGIARDAALLDRNDAMALTMLASAECVAGDLSAAAVHVDRALAIDPSSAWAWTRSGYIHCDLGKPDLALADFERALRLSRLDPMRHNAMIGTGFAYLLDHQYEAAVPHIERGLVESPSSIWANRELAAAAAMTGDREKAARCVAIVEGYAPGIRVRSILDAIPIRCDRLRTGFGRALARAGFSA